MEPGTVWLDASLTGATEESMFFTDPVRVITADDPEELPAVLRAIDAAAADGYYAAGYLTYEAGYGFVELPPYASREQPAAWFGIYEAVGPSPEMLFAKGADEDRSYDVGDLHTGLDEATYRQRIQEVRAHIAEGDVYQINFTDRIQFNFEGDASRFYNDLRRRQKTFYGAFINTGDRQILSLSPELFFRRRGNKIIARPMKGTTARGGTTDEDDDRARALAADEKSRAENLMIVDLLRNDVSRICRPGSVRLQNLFETERFETLTQMTSTIEGTLLPEAPCERILPALFPCGSVTGAPKRRAMKIIRDLEHSPRGVYCGAIGYAGPGDVATFNVAIRTIVIEGGQGSMGTGSGIVWDSDAGSEYAECLLKARFLTDATIPHAWNDE